MLLVTTRSSLFISLCTAGHIYVCLAAISVITGKVATTVENLTGSFCPDFLECWRCYRASCFDSWEISALTCIFFGLLKLFQSISPTSHRSSHSILDVTVGTHACFKNMSGHTLMGHPAARLETMTSVIHFYVLVYTVGKRRWISP